MVLVPRAELDALRAENRRLRREAWDREALRRIRSDSGEGPHFTRRATRGEGGNQGVPGSPAPRRALGRTRSTAAAAAEPRPQAHLPPARRTGPRACRAVPRSRPASRRLPSPPLL